MIGLGRMGDALYFGVTTWFLENQEKIKGRHRVTQQVSFPVDILSPGDCIYFLAISHL